ncbi:hypothetical protein QJQ45_006667 [Haematococcus lacustris]|nr:hypothetical protein QJQ45_006667 [Haematococcus lacustris]
MSAMEPTLDDEALARKLQEECVHCQQSNKKREALSVTSVVTPCRIDKGYASAKNTNQLREVQDAELAKRLQEEADMEQQFEVATQMVHDQLASKMPPKRNRKRPVSPAPSAAGASGSGQQVQGQGQAAKVVEQPSKPSTDPRPDRLVIVDEFRTTRVSSSVHARQPCELHLPPDQPRPEDWVPPAGQVNHRLLRPAWSLRHAKEVRGLKWCHQAPPNPPPPPPAPHHPAPAQDPPAPPPAQGPPPPPPAQAQPPPPPPAQAQPPPPAQDQLPAQPPPGSVPRPQAPPWGRWLDRDTNPCLNFQRIGESKQRPLELCRYEGLMALAPIGKEYQQGYKRVNDRLPKVKQRLHRAAEFRRGIDGRARNNA